MTLNIPSREKIAQILAGIEEALALREKSFPNPPPSEESLTAAPPRSGGDERPRPSPSGKNAPPQVIARSLGAGLAFVYCAAGLPMKEKFSSLLDKLGGGLLKGASLPKEMFSKVVEPSITDNGPIADEIAASGAGIVFLITFGMAPGTAKSLQDALLRREVPAERIDGDSLPGKAVLIDILIHLKARGG